MISIAGLGLGLGLRGRGAGAKSTLSLSSTVRSSKSITFGLFFGSGTCARSHGCGLSAKAVGLEGTLLAAAALVLGELSELDLEAVRAVVAVVVAFEMPASWSVWGC